ncbi:MAG: DUF4157 domain-containing protein, partial [Anaerolineales bacterium]|nr:DUF4157 domain-containing protein [Anaerolineales bacterium]
PGDKYEQEGDRILEQVMRMPEPQEVSQEDPHIQRVCEGCEGEELLQTKEKSGQNAETTSDLESRINAIRGGGQPLAESERAFYEPRFGYDFSRVRLHNSPEATQMARAMNAKAFTSGQDIVFGVGQYIPETSTGKKLIAHELTHVVQQSGNEVRPKLTVNALKYRYEQKVGRVPQENRRTLRPLGERIKTSLNKMSLPYIQCERVRQCDSTPGFPTQNPQEVRDAHQRAIEILQRAHQRSQHPEFSDVRTAAQNWFGITNFHTSSGLIRTNWQIVIDSIRRMNRRASGSVYHCHTTQTGICRPNTYGIPSAWTGLVRIHICPHWWVNINNRVRTLTHEWAHRWIRVGSEHGVYGQAAILSLSERRRTRIADAYAGYICELTPP